MRTIQTICLLRSWRASLFSHRHTMLIPIQPSPIELGIAAKWLFMRITFMSAEQFVRFYNGCCNKLVWISEEILLSNLLICTDLIVPGHRRDSDACRRKQLYCGSFCRARRRCADRVSARDSEIVTKWHFRMFIVDKRVFHISLETRFFFFLGEWHKFVQNTTLEISRMIFAQHSKYLFPSPKILVQYATILLIVVLFYSQQYRMLLP